MKYKSKFSNDTVVSIIKEIPTTVIDNELGMMSIEKGQYYSLDEIGKEIWNLMESPIEMKKIVETLLCDYDIDKDVCFNDVRELIEELYQNDLIKIGI